MKTKAELKPVLRSLQGRTAILCKALGNRVKNVLPLFKSHVFATCLYLCVGMSILLVSVFSTKIVQISDSGKENCLFTLRSNPAAILSECGVSLRPEDSYDFTGFNKNYGEIKIHRAFNVSVTADKKIRNVLISTGTVQDALNKAGITVNQDDILSNAPAQSVYNGMAIKVQRVTYQTDTQSKVLPCKTEEQPSTILARGSRKVLSPGKDGTFTVTTRVKYIDGEVAERMILKQEVTKEPVSAKVLVGSALRTPVSKIEASGLTLTDRGVPERYSRVVTGIATAYSAGRGAGTASGRRAAVGRVAVDPKIFPYGTRLYIVGADGSFVYGYAVAADTGGFASQGRVLVDLFFDSYAETCQFGAQQVKVYVLD